MYKLNNMENFVVIPDGTGKYTVDLSSAGEYDYSVVKAGYQTVTGTATVADEDVTVEIILKKTYTLTVRVKDNDGQLIEGATVHVGDCP
jgi:hypothetical protein